MNNLREGNRGAEGVTVGLLVPIDGSGYREISLPLGALRLLLFRTRTLLLFFLITRLALAHQLVADGPLDVNLTIGAPRVFGTGSSPIPGLFFVGLALTG